jgi:DHA1 family multidrug resistance protein-like MFS transporter
MTLESWQKNLATIFAAELLAIMAFTFVDPLMPLYIQQVGGFTTKQAAFWSGVAAGGLGVALFSASPLWGLVADRIGRKPMVLRAMFGGALIVTLMGFAPNIYFLIGLRWCQGLVTGTMAASSALATAMTPRNRISFAIGLITVAVFGGSSLGPLLGGVVADYLGYRATFYVSGGLLLLGGLIILLGVREKFERPARGEGVSLRNMLRLAGSKEMLPLLIALCLLGIGPAMVSPLISLLVKELNPEGQAATAAGLTFSLMGVAAAISSVVSGRLGERISLRKIMIISCLGTGLFYLPPMWAGSVGQLLTFLALTGLLRGGLTTSSNSLVGLLAVQSQQGVAYGLSQSASSLGSGLGPLIGGSLAQLLGLKPIFAVTAGLHVLVAVFIALLSRSFQRKG